MNNENWERFTERLNGGRENQNNDGLEFLINCEKMERLSNTEYANANPYIEAYSKAIRYIKNIYENPSLNIIRRNYRGLYRLIKRYDDVNVKSVAEQVINYADTFTDEAKQLKSEFFNPPYSSINHSFTPESNELLNHSLYYSVFEQIKQVFNVGTFGCVLHDALNPYPSREWDVNEEIRRLKSGLDWIKGEIVCAERNNYYVANP